MKSKKILVAGCGDLGSGIASCFIDQGHHIFAIRRTGKEFPESVIGITGDITQLADEALPAVDLIILIMTPQERTELGYRRAYYAPAQRLIERYQSAQTPVIFVSSTSVYGQNQGEWIDHNTPPENGKDTAQILLQTEALLAASMPSTAARCSGIYGPKRYRMLNKVLSDDVWEANSWTNRIHRHDVVRALCHLAEKMLQGDTLASHYALTDDTPVSMWEVKLCIANLLGTKANVGASCGAFIPSSGKRISNRALKETGFRFDYPSYVSGYEALVREFLSESQA